MELEESARRGNSQTGTDWGGVIRPNSPHFTSKRTEEPLFSPGTGRMSVNCGNNGTGVRLTRETGSFVGITSMESVWIQWVYIRYWGNQNCVRCTKKPQLLFLNRLRLL
jgi:hypothetical protein